MITCIRTERSVGAPVRLDVRGGPLRAMVLDTGPASARVALVAQTALLLAGDDVHIDIEVGAGVYLEVVEPSGTVAYDMRGGSAAWSVRVMVGPGGRLVWGGEPFVVSEGARVRRRLDVSLDATGSVLLRETLVLGRSGERLGRLTSETQVRDATGPILVEELDLSPASQVGGVLGRHSVLETVLALGVVPPVVAVESRMLLDRGGGLWRRLGPSAHEASLHAVWDEVTRAGRPAAAGATDRDRALQARSSSWPHRSA
jgi:urease accessory protein